MIEDDREFLLQRSVGVIRPDFEICRASFLAAMFESSYGSLQLESNVNKSTQAGVYLKRLKLIKTPLPPISLQILFENICEEFTNRISHGESVNDLVSSLKKEMVA